MKFGYVANGWAEVLGTPGAVTDMANGFYYCPGSLDQVLATVSEAGFDGIEIFDGNLLPFEADPTELRRRLDGYGLEMTGVYTGGQFIYQDAHEDELARFTRSIELSAALGAKHYVIGGGAVRTTGRRPEDYRVMADLLGVVEERAKAAGLIPSYHPHLGSIAEAGHQIDALFEASDIGLCADIAHIHAGGTNPAEVIRKYSDRLVYVHLKDADANNGFVALGEGVIDLPDTIAAVQDSGYQDWVTVELDGYAGDPNAGVLTNREYLRQSALAK